MVTFIRPTAWKIFSKERPSMMMTENEKAVLEYARPIWITAGSVVNRARKRGMTAMLASVRISPWRGGQDHPVGGGGVRPAAVSGA